MKTYRISPAVLCSFLFLLFVASCRNDKEQVITEPGLDRSKSVLDTNRNARLMDTGISRADWEDNLSWAQQNWIDQQSDPEDVSYSLWNDEQILGSYLSAEGFSEDIAIGYPLYTYQIAAIGALHTKSVGASAAYTWVQMTYTTGYASVVYDIMYNFDVGKQVAMTYPNIPDLLRKVYKIMFIDGHDFKVPGQMNVGTYRGVPLYTASYMNYGSFTLPGSTRSQGGIYLQAGQQNSQDLIRHEFGHILQAEQSSLDCYYSNIAISSAWSAVKATVGSYIHVGNYRHQCYETETDANLRHIALLTFEGATGTWNYIEFPTSCSGYSTAYLCQ